MTHTDLSSKQIGNFINKTNHRLMKATDTTENAYKVQNYSTTCVYYGVIFKQLLFHMDRSPTHPHPIVCRLLEFIYLSNH